MQWPWLSYTKSKSKFVFDLKYQVGPSVGNPCLLYISETPFPTVIFLVGLLKKKKGLLSVYIKKEN